MEYLATSLLIFSMLSLNAQHNSDRTLNAKWKKGERFTRTYKMVVPATPQEIYPLLCPEREYKWLNDWKCTMIYSESGYAEGDAVFYQNTGFPFFKRITFYITKYNPDHHIEFLITINKVGSIKFSIDLKVIDNKNTELTWTHLVTTHSKFGAWALKKEYTEYKFNAGLKTKELDLIYWVQNHKKILTNRKC